MKQLIVLIAMIALGVTIAVVIGGFGKAAQDMGETAVEEIANVIIWETGD